MTRAEGLLFLGIPLAFAAAGACGSGASDRTSATAPTSDAGANPSARGGADSGTAGSGGSSASGGTGPAGDGGAGGGNTSTAPGDASDAGTAGATGGAGVLSGCTVSSSNLPSCSVPAGWTLVTVQGFESGSIPSSQHFDGAAIASGFAHTGSRAAVGEYTGGDQIVYWRLDGSRINSHDVYWSWWEYDEARGKLNQDFILGRRELLDSGGNRLINAYIDIVAGGCLFNCTQQPISLFADPYWSKYGPATDPGWGAWTQWEVHMNNGTGTANDGDAQIYRNGTLLFHASGLNYHYEMSAADLDVGGVYTYLVWWKDSSRTQCASGHSSYTTNYSDWSQFDPCPNQAPPDGHGIPFKRYFDDIIVLKR